MNRQEKEKSVVELKDSIARAEAVLFADYKGVTSNEINDLRFKLREQDLDLRVVKNNLIRKAVAGTPKADAMEKLVGPTAALFCYKDAASAAKVLEKFADDVEAFTLKDGFLGDEVISEAQVKALASLPSKEALVGQLLSVMNGPIRNFVCVLNAVQRDFVGVLSAIADKKEKE